METFKHFSLEERIIIQNELNSRKSFKAISEQLGKAPSSISREIRRHIEQKESGSYGRQFNDCANRSSCTLENVCQGAFPCSRKLCRNCKKCKEFCCDYRKETCSILGKPPYVCNGCEKRIKCTLEKSLYKAVTAEEEASLLLRESRSGISLDEDEIQRIDDIVTPLVLQGQSIHHICCSNKDSIMSSERTIYNYVNNRVLTTAVNLSDFCIFPTRKNPAKRSLYEFGGCRFLSYFSLSWQQWALAWKRLSVVNYSGLI